MNMSVLGWVIALVVVLLVVVWAVWWARTRSGSAIRSFYLAVRQMEQDQGVQDHYQSPWILMVGDEAQGAQLCANWNLSPTDKPAWFGRWWSDPDGAVLVVPQSLFLPDESLKLQGGGWWNLLGLFLRTRAQRPLDAVIWTVAAADLLDGEKSVALGLAARRRFIDILQRLGITLPVYVVITGMDEVPGFQELISALPEDAREQPLGWASPYAHDAIWQSHWSDVALDELMQALSEAVIQIGALSGQLSGDLSYLPERINGLRRNLQMLLEPVFQGNAQGEAPAFRGLYFTSGQASSVDSEALSALDAPIRQSAFAPQLWQHRITSERGLAQPIERLLHLRQRWQRVTAAVAVVVGVVWVFGMLWNWRHSVSDAAELSRLLQGAQSDYVAVTDEGSRLELTRRNVQSFWNVLEKAPRWHFSVLAYPSSWFSSLDERMDQVLLHTSMTHMRQPIHDLLQAQLKEVLTLKDNGGRGAPDGDDPAQWQQYVKARELVEKTLRLEKMAQLYTQALNNQKTPLDDLVPLSNAALGLNLNAGTLHREAFYNRLLVNTGVAQTQPMDLSAHRKAIVANFTKLMDGWLSHYFRVDGFVTSAGYLKLHLERLEASSDNSLEELERLKGLIDNLQAAVDLTNSTWSRGKGQDLVPGYRELLENVRLSKILGPQVAQEVEAQAAQMQHTFKGQWIAQGVASNNLLVQSGSGQLALQERISQLRSAIELLLKRDFVAQAMRHQDSTNGQETQYVDNDGLSVALSYYESYKLYNKESVATIPTPYRHAVLKTAEHTAADSMWLSLRNRGSQPGNDDQPAFTVRTDQALALHKAFIELQRPDLAISLQNYLNRVALSDVSTAIGLVLEQPLFHERADVSDWDGSKNFGLRLFRATDVQDLKRTLEQQFSAISKLTELHAPAVEWLKAQQHNLPLADADLVARFAALSDEMAKYKTQNPSSSPALISQLVSRDFNEMDDTSCMTILTSAMAPTSTGQLTQRWVVLQQSALQRCHQLQQQQASGAWNALAGYFNQYLAGRFPFSNDLRASDADPARVQHFLTLIDTHLAQAEDGLRQVGQRDRLAGMEFLARLKLARPWLGALLMRDKAGLLGVDMEVRWRTDRDSERGADQVIAWRMGAGNQGIEFPGDTVQTLHWNVGQPINLRLRWAKNGTQRPVNDPVQPNLRVNGLEAEWQYLGPWALLRLMTNHVSTQRQPNIDYTEFPIGLEVPVHAAQNEENQTMMFLRLSLMSQGGKAPLSIQPLPYQAPRSPFGYAPRTVADAGVLQ